MNLQPTENQMPNFVTRLITKKTLALISILAAVVMAGMPSVQAQGFEGFSNPSIGARVEISLFGNNNFMEQTKLFVGLRADSALLPGAAFNADTRYRQANLPLFDVQVTGNGSLPDIWTSNLAPKKALFIAVLGTTVGVISYLAISDAESTEKIVTVSSTVILAGLAYYAATGEE